MRAELALSSAGGARARALVLAFVLTAAVGCDGALPEDDAGMDAGHDAAVRDVGPPDTGPICEPGCGSGQTCCTDESGAPFCTTVATDVRHCGRCGLDCVASGRGDRCRSSNCGCGIFDLGCIGNMASFCCVPPPGEGEPHCANLFRDPDDCGECNRRCDRRQANRCEGGRCLCGDERRACRGTPDDLCCPDFTEFYSCVDTTGDPAHCGGCGERCPIDTRCVDSRCIDPRVDAGT